MSTSTPNTGSGENGDTGSRTPSQTENRRYVNRNRRYTRNQGNPPTGSKFKGATSELEDCTFGVHEGYAAAKKYSDNIKKLKIYDYKHCDLDQGALFGKSPSQPTIEKPELVDKTDTAEVELYKLELREYMDEKRKSAKDTKKMYAVILGQCTEALLSKIKANDDFEEMNDAANTVWLIGEIRKITYLADKKEDTFLSGISTTTRLYRLTQDRDNIITYYETWVNMAEVLRQKAGTFVGENYVMQILEERGSTSGLEIKEKLDKKVGLKDDEMKKYIKARKLAEERWLAGMFIQGLSSSKYKRMKAELANQYNWGTNSYPQTIPEAYDMAL